MDNQDETLHGLEDEYLDDVIRLAVKRERMQEAEEILRLSREPVSPEEESRLDRIWSQALAKMDEIESRKKKAGRARTLRSAIINFSRIAACLAVLIVIGAGFAVATNSTFRSAVYNLFVTQDQDYIYVNFGKETTFEVPDGWAGLYFPSAIPPEYENKFMLPEPETAYIEYEAENGSRIIFQDFGFDSDGTFDKNIASEIEINGRTGFITESADPLSYVVSWPADDRWLTLTTYDLTKEETMDLVNSVRRINPEN